MYGASMEYHTTKSREIAIFLNVKNEFLHQEKQPFEIRSFVFSCFQSIFGIFFGDYQYFFVSLQSIYIINIEIFNI
jgi:hypothetical protein